MPFEGKVLLEERFEPRKHPVEYRLRVSIGEAEPLYPAFLSPADLLGFVAEARRSPDGQTQALIETLGINYLTQPLGACSSGMVKKVSLALAFLGQPRVVILDEPLITIDQEARAALFGLINRYHREGTTFLLSSHQPFAPTDLPLTARYTLTNRTLQPLSLP